MGFFKAGDDLTNVAELQAELAKVRREKAALEQDRRDEDAVLLERFAKMRKAGESAKSRVAELEARLSGPGRYLVDGGYGTRVFKTLAEAREWALTQIKTCREKANRTGKWPGQVEAVAIWVAIEQARVVPDEDGFEFELAQLHDKSGDGVKDA